MFRSMLNKPDLMQASAINEALRAGEALEKKDNLVEAYFLYQGLVAANPSCKACRGHMGTALRMLEEKGLDVHVEQKKVQRDVVATEQATEATANTIPVYK